MTAIDSNGGSDPRPPLSIVIEWENAGRIGAARARRMLTQLHAQLDENAGRFAARPEVLLMFNDRLNTQAEIGALVDAAGDAWAADIRFMPALDGGYYEQKNHGAAHTTGEVLIFLDSDVVPEPGWLAGLLDAIVRPEVQVVCGTTSIEPLGFYAKCMAMIWFFPMRTAERDMVRANRFFANNVAFRRGVFQQHGFPDSGQYRGQCALLAEQLLADGNEIWRNRASHVLHPPPDGMRHFVLRALWHGHDDLLHKRQVGLPLLREGTRQLRRDLSRVRRNIREHRRALGVGAGGGIGAFAIGLGYHGLKYAAFLATLALPGATGRALARANL